MSDFQNLTNPFSWVPTIRGISRISPDCQWFGIYGPYSPLLYVYGIPGLEPVATLASRGNIGDFTFSPTGDEIAISSRCGVEFWTTNGWTRTRMLTNFTGILFSSDQSTWWLTSDFRTAGLYEAGSVKPLLLLPTGTLPLALSHDGRRLAVSVDARRLQLWDLQQVRNQLRELGLDWGGELPKTLAFKRE